MIDMQPIVYSANQGLPPRAAQLAPAAQAWGDEYGARILNYENDFIPDVAVYADQLGERQPATVVALSVRDTGSNKGMIGLLNDSSEGTIEGNHFKSEFVRALRQAFKRANINAAVYENKVNFILVIDGDVDPQVLTALYNKAISDINPNVTVMENGKRVQTNIFKGGLKPEPRFAWTVISERLGAGELKSAADRLIKIAKYEKKTGLVDFAGLQKTVNGAHTAAPADNTAVDANWRLVNENWGNYESAFHDCERLLPDEFEAALRDGKRKYGMEIDPQTKSYLIQKNRQLYFEGASGAYNREAFLRVTADHLASKADNVFIGAGDIYNVGGMNDVIGPTLTDRYLKVFFDSWKEVGRQFNVNVRVFRMGGDEFAVEFTGASADQAAEMTMAFDKLMNGKHVLTPEVLGLVPAGEKGILLKTGLIRRLANGEYEVVGKTFGEISRAYAKIKGVITKGSQFSLHMERIPVGEGRADAGHFFEHLYQRASRTSNKPDSATVAKVTEKDRVVVMDNSNIEAITSYADYAGVRLELGKDNLRIVKRMLINDPGVKLISLSKVNDYTTLETWQFPNGRELAIRVETGIDSVMLKTSDGRVIKLKTPPQVDIQRAERNVVGLKRLFANSEEIKAYVDRLKARGMSDSAILEESIARLEEIGQKDFARQARMLKAAGRIATPLMFAMTLYAVHMINTAPPNERAKLFAGFAAGFGMFLAGAKLGYKFAPPNLLAKAGVGFALGTLFAIGGDVGVKSFINSIPGVKSAFESKTAQAGMVMFSFLDPITMIATEMDSKKLAAERKKKNEFIVKNGIEGWNRYVGIEAGSLRDRLAMLNERMKNPIEAYMRDHGISAADMEALAAGETLGGPMAQSPAGSTTSFEGSARLSDADRMIADINDYVASLGRQIGNLSADLDRLQATTVAVDRNKFRNEADYRRFLESLRGKAKAELNGEVIIATEG